MESTTSNNKRIAKNTLLLYFRMLLIMAVTLYTSRVLLAALGVEDFGIYNVVGGVVSMFAVLSGSLSAAISRFLTYELGKGNQDKLNSIFSSSVTIQLVLCAVIILVAETLGLWFLNCKMNIPATRMVAANWVYQFSILTFCINLISVPYNAAIIAHEQMSAFAYISIVEALGKLLIAFLISISPIDRLIFYAILMAFVAIGVRFCYTWYCKRHFTECTYHFLWDKDLLKQMFGFAGWNFLGNGAFLFNTQGVNILINIFFGVAVNAARGVANQVNNAVMQFSNNFSMALNPQIIKSYAAGDKETSFILVCRGAKFTYFLLLILMLPIMLESNQILEIWLKVVPDNTCEFLIWTLLGSLVTAMGSTMYTLMMAQGDIKRYQIIITLIGCLPFPLTWVAYKLGASAVWAFSLYFIVYYILVYVRLVLVHNKTGIPYVIYIKEVIVKTHLTTLLAIVLPLLVVYFLKPSFPRLLLTCVVSVLSCCLFIYLVGFERSERTLVSGKINSLISKISKF